MTDSGEAIVLFTSREVISDKAFKAFPYSGCDKPESVRHEIVRNLKKIWKRADPDVGRKIFWCEVNIDDFQDCFDKIVKAAYRFSPFGRRFGANSIGFGVLSMARLTWDVNSIILFRRKENIRKR